MARYIDADALYKKLYPLDLADKRKYTINAKAVADAIANIPTADVVPKSEVEATVEKFMSATDKVICEAKAEVAREIFEEIDKGFAEMYPYFSTQLMLKYIAELKKKYTEGEE